MNPLTITGLLVFLAGAASFFAIRAVWDWLAGQYEMTPLSPWRYRVTRRWYGPGARIRIAGDGRSKETFKVTDLDGNVGGMPWVRVLNLDNAFNVQYWGPVTDFVPFMMRRFRPRLLPCRGRVPWLCLFRYEPAPVCACASSGPGRDAGASREWYQ